MGLISVDEYKELIKRERDSFFKSSLERAYQGFLELKYDKKTPEFFEKNASEIVERMRKQCWEDFLIEERNFTIHMLKKLIDESVVKNLSPKVAIEWYLENYPEHIYQLNLSNTQSRRSRAGKEFEDIIELILIGANVPMDSQGNIGKEQFINKGLGKLVDAVSPGVIEFEINKRNTVLISAKTTLRERWQEVPEEMGRTGASEMFLATLDEKISNEVLTTLYEANIQVTTTKENKEKNYADNNRVLTFENLISICKENCVRWNSFVYSKEQVQRIIEMLKKQIEKRKKHSFVKDSFEKRMKVYEELMKK